MDELSDKKISLLVLGKKGIRFFQRKDFEIVKSETDIPVFFDYSFSETISDYIIGEYLKKKYSQVYVVYASFVSLGKNLPVIKKLLPLELNLEEHQETKDVELLEPDRAGITDYLLPEYLKSMVWDLLLNSSASEHASRAMAMEQASKNAVDIIGDLQLLANKLRQASITSELTDIMGSMEGMV